MTLNKVRGAALTARLNALLAERGIQLSENRTVKPLPTVTILAPLAVVNRLAHDLADRRMAADPKYAADCAAVDSMLPAIAAADLELPAAKRSHAKTTRSSRVRHVMINDYTAMNELNYLPGPDAAELLVTAISALRLELANEGCPDIVIDRTVSSLRADFDWSRELIRKLESGAVPAKRFGCFRSR